jgi:hypothetical protein
MVLHRSLSTHAAATAACPNRDQTSQSHRRDYPAAALKSSSQHPSQRATSARTAMQHLREPRTLRASPRSNTAPASPNLNPPLGEEGEPGNLRPRQGLRENADAQASRRSPPLRSFGSPKRRNHAGIMSQLDEDRLPTVLPTHKPATAPE